MRTGIVITIFQGQGGNPTHREPEGEGWEGAAWQRCTFFFGQALRGPPP